MSRSITTVFTSSGTWTAPAGVTRVTINGIGAGGGGGGGGGGDVNFGGEGGGGGGGAINRVMNVTVVPGTTYTITIGVGGGGGNGGTSGNNGTIGTDGGDTTFDGLATFRGASAGSLGLGFVNTTTTSYTEGGQPAKAVSYGGGIGAQANAGVGGTGLSRQSGDSLVITNGAGTSVSSGGAAGLHGQDATRQGGGPGGGGGSSTWIGNVPGIGADGTPGFGGTFSGNTGSVGTLGAGGGGGGGGGGTINGQGLRAGLVGNAGGNGALTITWID